MKHYILVFITALIVMTSCKNKESKKEVVTSKTQTEQKTPKEQPKNEQNDNLVKLVINSNDQMQFDKKELHVKAGTKVSLTLNHTGKMAKQVMGHNWVLLKKGTNITDFANKASKAKKNDYIPKGDEIIAHTKTLGGGESTTITFDAPAKGKYVFICSFPAHYALMKGELIVE